MLGANGFGVQLDDLLRGWRKATPGLASWVMRCMCDRVTRQDAGRAAFECWADSCPTAQVGTPTWAHGHRYFTPHAIPGWTRQTYLDNGHIRV